MSSPANRPILVTGGAGFIGSNLADRLATDGHDVLVLDALTRAGVERNLAWLKSRHGRRIGTVIGDVCDAALVRDAVRDARAVFHFAAQVAVTTSLSDPAEDFRTNIAGTFNILEAARQVETPPPVIFASTNKVYGDLSDLEFDLTPEGYEPLDRGVRRYGISMCSITTAVLVFRRPYCE
jgi:CDP-paratose 2-epimerase